MSCYRFFIACWKLIHVLCLKYILRDIIKNIRFCYVRHVAETLAQVRNVPLETIAQQTTQNACTLFGIQLNVAS